MSPTISSDPSETLVVGPGHLADNLEHGSLLPPRIQESFHLIRQLDIASRLLTTRTDRLLGATEGLPKEEVLQEGGSITGGDGGPVAVGKRKRKGSHDEKEEATSTGGKSSSSSNHHHPSTHGSKKKGGGGGGQHQSQQQQDASTLRSLQHAALRCADEKVALAVHVYDLLDTQIRHIDSDLRRFEKHFDYAPPLIEEERRRNALAAAGGGGQKGGGLIGKGGSGGGGGTSSGMIGGMPRSAAGLFNRKSSAGGGGGGGGALGGLERGAMMAGGGLVINPGIDPNEPVYCFCRQVAFGEMIGCDNPNCEHEWFHYRCVGLTRQPTGNSWLCPKCKRLQNQQRSSLTGGGLGGVGELAGGLLSSASSKPL